MRTPSPWLGVVLRPDDALLARHAELFGGTLDDRLHALAEAIATSPCWSQMADRLRIVVRASPEPLLGVLGDAGDDDRPLLEALDWQIADSLRRMLPIDQTRAEAACVRLASTLRERVGAAHLRAARFVGLPRGGLLVLGLLSYVLDLEAWQLAPDAEQRDAADDTPVVVVDDCMLSGTQLRRWLRRHPTGPPVVAAHLHSHPDLRHAVERQEARVAACVAAADLWDHAPDDRGDGYDDWRDRWQERTPESYWIGNPDHVCYPWNEPDVLVWNERHAQVEPGWHVVPPRWCLKNRAAGRDAPAAVQSCVPPGSGTVRPASDVVWAVLDDAVVIAGADRGVATRLDGVAAQMWTAVTRSGDPGQAVDALAQRYEADRATIVTDLTRFVARLADQGLLHTTGADPSDASDQVEHRPSDTYPRDEVR